MLKKQGYVYQGKPLKLVPNVLVGNVCRDLPVPPKPCRIEIADLFSTFPAQLSPIFIAMKTFLFILGLAVSILSLSEAPASIDEIPFDINDYTWLVGSWEGDGFGGVSHETWEKPINGTMMGMYRHINAKGELVFYEFLLLDKTGLRLKHFNPDLTGWEEKDDIITFEMISFSEDKIELKGLTFERTSETEMVISLRMSRGGEPHTEVFSMKRN
jgi:hypothetical protein